jgi:hypothetical protein
MIHPNAEFRFVSSEKSYGLEVTKFITKSTIVWIQDQLDRTFKPAEERIDFVSYIIALSWCASFFLRCQCSTISRKFFNKTQYH